MTFDWVSFGEVAGTILCAVFAICGLIVRRYLNRVENRLDRQDEFAAQTAKNISEWIQASEERKMSMYKKLIANIGGLRKDLSDLAHEFYAARGEHHKFQSKDECEQHRKWQGQRHEENEAKIDSLSDRVGVVEHHLDWDYK